MYLANSGVRLEGCDKLLIINKIWVVKWGKEERTTDSQLKMGADAQTIESWRVKGNSEDAKRVYIFFFFRSVFEL